MEQKRHGGQKYSIANKVLQFCWNSFGPSASSPSSNSGGEGINRVEAGLISSCIVPLGELTGGGPLGESIPWLGIKAWAALMGWKGGIRLLVGLCHMLELPLKTFGLAAIGLVNPTKLSPKSICGPWGFANSKTALFSIS